jgi:leucyl aminopeptidase
LPIDIQVAVTPAGRPQPLDAYLGAVAERATDAPALIAVPVEAAAVGAAADEAAADEGGPRETGAGSAVPGAGAADLDDYLGASAAEVIAGGELTGRAGEVSQSVARLGHGVSRVLFLGVGGRSPGELRKAGAALARQVPAGQAAVTTAVLDEPAEGLQAFVQGLLLGSYRFSLKSSGPSASSPASPARVSLLVAGSADRARTLVEWAVTLAGAVGLARDLSNTPSSVKSPAWLAAQAVSVAERHGLQARIWTDTDLASGGFGGLLGVGCGSARPPRLIELRYQPPGSGRHVVLVGKGITFDSGGLSLKPNDSMKLMKTDMAGGAAVIAVMSALAALGVTARVTGLVAAAENMPSGSALRIGDVITHYGGRSVEVLNTDAEGRLVLADALAYADKVLDPDVLVDIATLTGAARVALGSVMAAMYATDDALAADLLAAGTASGDRLWRMPLAGEYCDGLESSVADLANVATGTGRAGSIDAALFLREFTGGRRWAHLDIAGPARATADDGESTKGATGFGTSLLLQWLSGAGAGAAPADAGVSQPA